MDKESLAGAYHRIRHRWQGVTIGYGIVGRGLPSGKEPLAGGYPRIRSRWQRVTIG